MEFAKHLPEDFSEYDDTVEKDIENYRIRNQKRKESIMGLSDFQIKHLAEATTRKLIVEYLKKNCKLSASNSSQPFRRCSTLPKDLDNNSRLFKLPGEITIVSNEKYNNLCLSATCNCILGILGFLCSAVLYDIEYPDDFFERNIYLWYRLTIFNTVLTVILLLSIIWRKYCELDWEKSKQFYNAHEDIVSTSKIYSLTIELILNALHPIWFLEGKYFESYNEVLDITVRYSYNSMLSIVAITRLYHIFRLALLQSRYSTGRAQRVCKINGVIADKFWALKCMIITSPFKTVFCMFLIGIFIGGYCLRIFERPMTSPDAKTGFFHLGNAMWCIIITMTTVGFGDIFPVSIPGRIVDTLACIWGVFVVALMVVGITNIMLFDSGEEKAYTLHLRLKFKEYFRKIAGCILITAFRLKVMTKKNPHAESSISKAKSAYKRNILAFQKAKIESNILYHTNTPERRIESRINEILNYAEENMREAEKVYNSLSNIKNKFN